MEYEEIIEETRRASGGLTGEAAERAAQATLQTLAERLPSGEARHILAELPAELKPWIYTETEAAAFGIDEFLDQVAQREGVDIETALSHARAVFFALGDALSPREVQHLAASLPETYQPLVAEAQHMYLEIMPADQFWARVAQRLSTGEATARQITGAVLQTLAERIAAGQVEDLIAQLDPLLHPPLRRGMSATGPDARRMPLAEFLRRIAGREGADVDEADLFEETFGHARAVFTTLASAVDPKEWFDVLVELPEEYRSLIPERTALPTRTARLGLPEEAAAPLTEVHSWREVSPAAGRDGPDRRTAYVVLAQNSGKCGLNRNCRDGLSAPRHRVAKNPATAGAACATGTSQPNCHLWPGHHPGRSAHPGGREHRRPDWPAPPTASSLARMPG